MLWNVGSVYVVILLIILVAGMGMGIFKLLETTGDVLIPRKHQKHHKGGGKNKESGILGYAAMAFTTVIVGYFTLGLLAVNGSEQNHDHAAHVAQQTTNSTQQISVQSSFSSAPQDQSMAGQLNSLDRELGAMEHNFNNQGYRY
ncbi:MAG TPA: hypothetical protein VHS59_08620 [Bacillota bacterium]|nr:hypothetical protein [Bacillota bacterium]